MQTDSQKKNNVDSMETQRRIVQDMIDNLDQYTFSEIVPIQVIHTAPYCRPVSEYRVNLLLRQGFDVRKMGSIKTSMRADGQHYILDGNHRREAAKKLGLTSLPAQVFIDLTYEEEAELFIAFNTVNRPTAMDRFRARLEKGDEQALDIQRILESVGMKIALNGPAIGQVSSIAATDRAYEDLGEKGLTDIVQILYAAWGNSRRAWVNIMIDGMRQFWGRYRTEIVRSQLIDKLQMVTPEWLLAQAGMGYVQESPGTRLGKQIVARYNWKRPPGTRLGEWVANPGPGRSFYQDKRSDTTGGKRFRMRTGENTPRRVRVTQKGLDNAVD